MNLLRIFVKFSLLLLILLSVLCISTDATTKREQNRISIRELIHRGRLAVTTFSKTTVKFAGRVWEFVPTPETVFNIGKQVLIGLPQEVLAYGIDKFCSAAVHLNAVTPSAPPNINEMNFEFLTQSGENITIPLLYPDALANHVEFRRDFTTVLLVTGWNSNINKTNDALETLYAAYQTRDVNFVIFDTAQYVNSLYTWSAFNTATVGQIIGETLADLTEYIDLNRVHLIGHSLGAHICGFAGRTFTKLTNELLPRITGLDPARPCFNEGERLNGLQRGDAHFVDIIHSNAGILGIKDPIGDVDFYPNGRHALQPGCWSIICAHSRAYEYYAETVRPGNENNFIATRCNSYSAYKRGKCIDRQIPMGIATPNFARGNFYLKTNKRAPFGQRETFRKFTRRVVKLVNFG